MQLYYNVNDKPSFGKILVFAFQQLLAILAATIAVPSIINNACGLVGEDAMSQSAALFGAGVGTLVYIFFTKKKSPVFLGSSFAFINSMIVAFAGATTVCLGYFGLIIGAILAGLVYVLISVITKYVGTAWLFKIMPKVVIGPTVAIIGLSLAGNAIGDLLKGSYYASSTTWSVMSALPKEFISSQILLDGSFYVETASSYVTTHWAIALLCGLITLFTTVVCSCYGKKTLKMIPFICGIGAGYAVAAIFTGFGFAFNNDALKVIDFAKFANIEWVPNFTFVKGLNFKEFGDQNILGYIVTIACAYIPVAFVVFAEHVADHRNLGKIIGTHLLRREPGLKNTLLGDGVGSMVGAFFGGCPNTTYGESIACVAISGNASVVTTFATAILAIIASFVGPFTTLLSTIPSCVMGGVCIALYGFISVSGLKMLQGVDLNENGNLFTASTILICGIGGLVVSFAIGQMTVTFTSIFCALFLGIIVNVVCGAKRNFNLNDPDDEEKLD